MCESPKRPRPSTPPPRPSSPRSPLLQASSRPPASPPSSARGKMSPRSPVSDADASVPSVDVSRLLLDGLLPPPPLGDPRTANPPWRPMGSRAGAASQPPPVRHLAKGLVAEGGLSDLAVEGPAPPRGSTSARAPARRTRNGKSRDVSPEDFVAFMERMDRDLRIENARRRAEARAEAPGPSAA